jgi:ABC-2 type transport system permease protein
LAERPAFGVVVAASVRRALVEETSELVPIALHVISFALGLLSQAFLGRLVDAGSNAALGAYQGHFATFLILGLAFLDLQNSIASALSRAIRDAQMHGSLESMLATPTPVPRLLFALAVPDAGFALFRLLLYVAAGALLFHLRLGDVNPFSAVAVLLVSLAAFASLSLVGAALTMILRRADPLSLLIAATSMIAGGVFYPRTILPKWLMWAGDLLPIAPALDALRAAVVYGASPIDPTVLHPLVRLLAFVAVVGPLGGWLFGRTLVRARQDGSLTAF